jgi:hypothetical protein
MVRDPRDDVITDWSEQEIRRGLAVLLRQLRGAVADTVCEGRLTQDEHIQLYRYARHFLPVIPRLAKALKHPEPERRREQLYDFYAALGAVAVIFGHRVDDPILNRLIDYERAAALARKNAARKNENKQIIAEEWAKLSRPELSDKAKARYIQKRVQERTGQELEIDTITKYRRESRAEETD